MPGPTPSSKAPFLPLPRRDQHPDKDNPDKKQDSTSSSPVHLSQSSSYGQAPSRNNSPFIDIPHPDSWAEAEDEDQDQDESRGRSRAARGQQQQDQDGFDDFDAWDPTSPSASLDMPSDLRTAVDRGGKSHTPLLAGDRDPYQDYASPTRPTLRTRRSTFRERDPLVEARAATRKKYVYAACFLVLSLISFTVQTETAVYIQHNLKWNKAYCML